MNRREFSKRAAASAMVLAMAGCGVETIEEYINAVDTAVTGVLNLMGDSALAAKIQAAVKAVNAAMSTWKTGTIPQMVVEALGMLQAALDAVPLSNVLSMAIGIAIAAIDAILDLSGGTIISSPGPASAGPWRQHPKPNLQLKTRRSFAKAWNSAIDNAGLPAAAKVAVPLF